MEFLVDSGADYTLISASNAFLIGIDYKKINKPEMKIEVANLTFIKTKKVHLTMCIENQIFCIPVLVANQEVENLLGRKGFFDKFDILFQERLQQMIFKENLTSF